MNTRLHYLGDLYKKGLVFKLVFLVGQRIVQPFEKEQLVQLCGPNTAETETDAAKLLYQSLATPLGLAQKTVVFIDAPAKVKKPRLKSRGF